ncbi:MAG TPA: carboxypeptidase regulatory-like domain-containing protein [Polyangiaceae bacterium]|nr:carboxypeptidase regulatory-like domain-containing protein [Polyangiaceae bacterium]
MNSSATTVIGGPCTGNGYNCRIDPCEGGSPTTITAKVYDPAAKNPLFNVAVYVPNTDLDPIATGPTCDNCATPVSGSPVASALTDTSGQFVMTNAPDGANVPLVMQIGKWRREITLPQVNACQNNAFDDPSTFRLPANQSEGNIPMIALGVGGADTLECLLLRIGVSSSDFTNPGGGGRVNLFVDDIAGGAGIDTPTSSYTNGAVFPNFSSLFTSVDSIDDGGFIDSGLDPLSAYDLVMISCQGSQAAGRAVTSAEKQGLKAFVDNGGRSFLSHYNYSWLRGGDLVDGGKEDLVPSAEGAQIDLQTKYTLTPFPAIAVWEDPATLTYAPGGDGTYLVNTSFARGSDMALWLYDGGASTILGQIDLVNVKDPATSAIASVAESWIYQDASGVPYISANTPIEQAATPDAQCGRIVQTGIHVAADVADTHDPFPSGCVTADLTPQEKALEFLFFDLSSCVTDETQQPSPPVVPR